MKKETMVLFLSFIFGLLTGCLNPDMLVDPNQLAKRYLTSHPKFVEKYGADYTLVHTGGGGGRDIDRKGTSGTESYNCTINGTDTFSVALSEEKRKPWKVDGVVCTSAKYACNELNLIFEGSARNWATANELDLIQPNGVLYFNGEKIDVMVVLVSTRVLIFDAKLYRQYKEKQALTKPNKLNLPREQEEACTLLICRIIGDFDMFTATPEDAYKEFTTTKEYHFYVVDEE